MIICWKINWGCKVRTTLNSNYMWGSCIFLIISWNIISTFVITQFEFWTFKLCHSLVYKQLVYKSGKQVFICRPIFSCFVFPIAKIQISDHRSFFICHCEALVTHHILTSNITIFWWKISRYFDNLLSPVSMENQSKLLK